MASMQEVHAAAGDAMLEYNSMDEFLLLTGNLSWFGDWCVNRELVQLCTTKPRNYVLLDFRC